MKGQGHGSEAKRHTPTKTPDNIRQITKQLKHGGRVRGQGPFEGGNYPAAPGQLRKNTKTDRH